uniref:Putative serpin-like protein n=1 Tax=Sipha flava TaxID=143950 RepID=A0A2S2PZ79_9HEMI
MKKEPRLQQLQEVSTKNDENLFASTLSVNLLLMLLAIRSNGKTSDQLKTVLKLPKNRTLEYNEYNPVIKIVEELRILTIAIGIFANQTFDLSVDYVYLARKYLKSEVWNLHFIGNPVAAEMEINE